MAKKIGWGQAAEIIGISDRQTSGRAYSARSIAIAPAISLKRRRRLQDAFWAITQVGLALKDLGIQMILAYSPQRAGRSERNFGTWQRRQPQELWLRGITTVEAANAFLPPGIRRRIQPALSCSGDAAWQRLLALPPRGSGHRFLPASDAHVGWRQHRSAGRVLAADRAGWLAGILTACRVIVHEHLLRVSYGPHLIGRYNAQGCPLLDRVLRRRTAAEKPVRGKRKLGFPLRLEIPQQCRDSHF